MTVKDVVSELAISRCVEAVFTGGDIVWSASGKTLYSTCTNVVKSIDLEHKLNVQTVASDSDRGRVTALCMDEERQRLLVAFNSGLICEFSLPTEDVASPSLVRSWKPMHTAPVHIMKFNSDYTVLVTASSDFTVKVWNMRSQTCIHHFPGQSVVTAICFVRNGRILVGYMDGTVSMFNINPGVLHKLMHQWQNHQSHVTSISEVPETRKALLISRDQTCSIVDMETFKTQKTLPFFEAIEDGLILEDRIYTVGERGVMCVWSIESGRQIRSKQLVSHGLKNIAYNAVTNQFLIVTEEEIVLLLSAETFDVNRQIVGFHDEVFSVAVAGRGEGSPGFLTVAANSNQIRLYDMTTWDCRLVDGHTSSVLSVKVAPWEPQIVASCSKDNLLFVWRLNQAEKTLQPIAIGTGHTSTVSSLAFSHSGKQAFVLTASYDTTLKLWDLRKHAHWKAAGSAESCTRLSCSSTIVAHHKDITAVDCSPNDALCLTASMDKTVKLWKIDTGKMQLGIAGTLSGHKRGIWDARFSPNAQKVVTCSGDQTMKIFKVSDFSCLQTLSGHNFAVLKVEWINNGTQLISADSGGVLKIWKSDGECGTSIEAHNDKIWSLCSSPDESEFITAGSDGKIILWNDISEEKREQSEKEHREKAAQEQTLSNLMSQERYLDALDYALALNRPFCALKVVNELGERKLLMEAVSLLSVSRTRTLLDFATQWNTNSRTALASQQVLNSVLHSMPPEELLKLPNVAQTLQAFIPYTKRHVERLNKARQDASLLNFTMSQMRIT